MNSYALKMAGIDRNTPDPPGGEIERDEKGEPTGVLKENARNLIIPFIPEEKREDTVQSLVDLGELLLSQGIVAVTDMGNLDGGDNYPLYEEAAEKGFKQEVAVYYIWDFFMDKENFTLPEEGRQRQAALCRRAETDWGRKCFRKNSLDGETISGK